MNNTLADNICGSKVKKWIYISCFMLLSFHSYSQNDLSSFKQKTDNILKLIKLTSEINIVIDSLEFNLYNIIPIRNIVSDSSRKKQIVEAYISYPISGLSAYDVKEIIDGLPGKSLIERISEILHVHLDKIIIKIYVQTNYWSEETKFFKIQYDKKKLKQVYQGSGISTIKEKDVSSFKLGWVTEKSLTGVFGLYDTAMISGNNPFEQLGLGKSHAFAFAIPLKPKKYKVKYRIADNSEFHGNDKEIELRIFDKEYLSVRYERYLENFLMNKLKQRYNGKISFLQDDNEVNFNALNGVVIGNKEYWENVQIIYFTVLTNLGRHHGLFTVFLTIDGKFVKIRPRGNVNSEYIDQNGKDFENSSFSAKLKEFGGVFLDGFSSFIEKVN
ncbi:hypothetical protein [Flagellimonas algicola]|uniref:Uncharacterized protein n=1 Tax=Flagellimonas algicola TaxID=2583815 RepID=A0ABY2WIY3_9FLAO|nr:hypothetical protein [Allomuricauda algicola]TMU54808.1 hypothetical protein FGG15_11445 [Allomuricauda algicola]